MLALSMAHSVCVPFDWNFVWAHIWCRRKARAKILTESKISQLGGVFSNSILGAHLYHRSRCLSNSVCICRKWGPDLCIVLHSNIQGGGRRPSRAAVVQRIRGFFNHMRYINSRFTYLLTYFRPIGYNTVLYLISSYCEVEVDLNISRHAGYVTATRYEQFATTTWRCKILAM